MGALWLKQVLTGQMALPSLEVMEQTIAKEKAWKRSWMPKKGDRAAILQLHKMAYHDQLCRDMGVNPRRKGWNLLAEVFAPYSAADYTDLFAKEEATGKAVALEAENQSRRALKSATAPRCSGPPPRRRIE